MRGVTDETESVPTPPQEPATEPAPQPATEAPAQPATEPAPQSGAAPAPPASSAPERDNGPIVLGGLFVLVGLALFATRALDLDLFSTLGWPAIVIGVGLVILIVGLVFAREEGMVVGGT